MTQFIEVPATKNALALRKKMYGIGINDAWYMVQRKSPRAMCKYYQTWSGMMTRGYSENHNERYPTYKDCSVVKEWHLFSNFRMWMEKQNWHGKALDKDIIKPGNKVYGPDTCCFVSTELNNILCDAGSIRGGLPQGVCWDKDNSKYRAGCYINGKRKNIGRFKRVSDAEAAYLLFKIEVIESAALMEDHIISNGLARHVNLLKSKLEGIR